MTQNAHDQWLSSLSLPGKPDEHEVKNLLDSLGIQSPARIRINPDQDAVLPDFDGPYVVKVCSGEILHKTDHGGVDLNIHKDDLAASISEMRERFEGQAVLVEEMAKFQGTEFIIGAMVDPEFGPAVMVGAGGILTELYKDVSFRLAPCSKTEAGRMIKELSVGPLFEGFRGINLDSDGLAEVISKAGELALALGDHFSQLDINPLVVSDGKWCALDAKLVLNEEKN